MHLPKATRRQIVYAAAAVLVSGGLLFTLRHPAAQAPVTSPDRVTPAAALLSHPETNAAMAAPQAQAPAGETKEVAKASQAPREKFQTHIVAEDETISGIAERYELSTDAVLSANDLYDDETISIGQELTIPSIDALVHTVAKGDSLWAIAADYGVSDADIVSANPDLDPGAIQPGQKVLIPGGRRPARNMMASRGESRSSAGRLEYWPTVGIITDSFGWRIHPVYGTSSYHDGMDINASSGTPLRAAGAGTVTMASRYGGYGLVVRIDHGRGLVTQYAHMDQIDVVVGQKVAAAEHLGYSGNTGVSTGPHLHFMVMVDGSPVDPMPWLP